MTYHATDMTFERYSADNLLPDDDISTIMVDRDDNVWIGTDSGIARFIPSAAPASAEDSRPAGFAVLGNHPNPFNPSTTITFSLPESGKASLTVYDITGRKVRTLVSERMIAGVHSVVWDGRDERGEMVASGIYLARLESGTTARTVKMLLMK
jgi:hypothetical protein